MSSLDELSIHSESQDLETTTAARDSESDARRNHEVPAWFISKLRASKYCAYCQSFMDGWSGILNGERSDNFDGAKYPYHESLSRIESAAMQGCKICWLFHHFLIEGDARDLGSFQGVEEEARSFLYIYPGQFWRLKRISHEGDDDRSNGYEGPFVEWNEWHMGIESADSRPLTPLNALSIVVPRLPCK
jgi:hypothetical protein